MAVRVTSRRKDNRAQEQKLAHATTIHQGLQKQRTAEDDYDEGTSFLLIRPMLLIVWVFLIRDYYTNSMCSNWWGRLVNPPSLFIVRIQQNTILNYLVLGLFPLLYAGKID